MEIPRLDGYTVSLVKVALLGAISAYYVVWHAGEVVKHFAISYLVSKLYAQDAQTAKHLDISAQSYVKKVVICVVVLQKLLCHAVLLYALHYEHLVPWRDVHAWWSEQYRSAQTAVILVNAFASFYFLAGYMEGRFWIPTLVPVLCTLSNLYLFATSQHFWREVVAPAMLLSLVFIVCCALFVNCINAHVQFQTPFLERVALLTERLGSYTLAQHVVDVLTAGSALGVASAVLKPAQIILATKFSVSLYEYPEQYLLSTYGSLCSYNEDCAICLDSIKFRDNVESDKKLTLTTCYHVFHEQCLAHWEKLGKSTCPICRTALYIEDQ